MKNIKTRLATTPAEETEELTLAEILGVPADNLLVCPAAGVLIIGEEISEDDLMFVDSRRIPAPSDKVLCESKGDLMVKLYSEIKPSNQHLCLVTRNGKTVNSSKSKKSFQIVGVVTHLARRIGVAK